MDCDITAVAPAFKAMHTVEIKTKACITSPRAPCVCASILPAIQSGAILPINSKYIISSCGHTRLKIARLEVDRFGLFIAALLAKLAADYSKFASAKI